MCFTPATSGQRWLANSVFSCWQLPEAWTGLKRGLVQSKIYQKWVSFHSWERFVEKFSRTYASRACIGYHFRAVCELEALKRWNISLLFCFQKRFWHYLTRQAWGNCKQIADPVTRVTCKVKIDSIVVYFVEKVICRNMLISMLTMFIFPAVSSSVSFLLSSTMSVILFAGMQLYRQQLASQEYMTIVGGFLGSILFIFILTVSLTHWSLRDLNDEVWDK